MLRLHLPPNFAAAVIRNAVPLRVELDLTQPPSAELLPVLALLQRWCGTPKPPTFIQLNRAQLRELAAAAGTQAIFVENGQPTWWRHAGLLGEAEQAGSNQDQVTSKVAATSGTDARPARPSSSQPSTLTPQPVGRDARPARPSSSASRMTIDGSEHFLAITLPSREHPQYDDALALLKENGFTLEPSNRKWWLRDRHKTLNFLAAHLTELQERFGAELTPNFEKNAARIKPAEITTDIGRTGGGFSVAIGVRAGDTDESTLRSAIASNRGYVESNGRIYLLDSAQLQKLATAQRALTGDPNAGIAPQRTLTVPPARTAEVQDILEQLSPNFQPPDAWRERSAALRNLTALQPAPVASDLDAQLRPYQRLGVAWLWHLQRHGLAGILADEMGLGKTLQALALLSAPAISNLKSEIPLLSAPPISNLKSEIPSSSAPQISNLKSEIPSSSAPQISNLKSEIPRASLVVSPASLLENWRREAARFTPQLRTFVHHGEHRLGHAADFAGYDLIITSYGTLTRDQPLFTSIEFACVIADEAQHIKNRRSQNAAALRALNARSRFLLTGTPVENSLDDLRSLFEFLLPGYLTRVPAGLRGDERAWYDDRLRAQTAPYILRRTKKSVAPELPDKIEQVVWCELTPAQAALYRETQERSERELFDLEASGASEAKLKFAALTQLLRLRQICCDPRLVGISNLNPGIPSVPSSEISNLKSEIPPVPPSEISNLKSEIPPGPPSEISNLKSEIPPGPPSEISNLKSEIPPGPSSEISNLKSEIPIRVPAGRAQSSTFQPSTFNSAAPSPAAPDSAKLDAFRELLEEAVDDGHRILVFSQFTSLLALLRAELDARETPYCYLDGSMPARARQAQVDTFQSNPDIPLFLLSLKAGGTGLNLTGADTVIIYDPWWNPAAEAQATDRAHRIGQKRTVTSYKLIAAGTVEEKVLALQGEKRALLADVFEASDAVAAKLSLSDLRDLVRA